MFLVLSTIFKVTSYSFYILRYRYSAAGAGSADQGQEWHQQLLRHHCLGQGEVPDVRQGQGRDERQLE